MTNLTDDLSRIRDPWAVRLVPLWCVGAGLVLGAVAGSLSRLWMRLITTEHPEFTWSGTLFIVGAFAVAGALIGPVVGARRRGWTGAPMSALRITGCVATLPLCLGQGAILAPTLVLGGLAAGRRRWRRWVRAVLGVVALANFAAVHLLVLGDWPHSTVRAVAAVVVGAVIYGGAVLALAQAYAPAPGARLPRAARLGFLGLPVAAVAMIGVPNAVEPATARVALIAVVVVAGAWLLRRRGRLDRAVDDDLPPLTAAPAPAPADR
jgi:hypothetical protein